MNSPLQRRKVRLRGLGGPTACGVPRTCASAASLLERVRSAPGVSATVREGGLCAFPAANSFAPGADAAITGSDSQRESFAPAGCTVPDDARVRNLRTRPGGAVYQRATLTKPDDERDACFPSIHRRAGPDRHG